MAIRRTFQKLVFALAGVLALASCDMPAPVEPSAKPKARPDAVAPPRLETPSEASRALSVYYKRLENDQIAQDLMRTGGGGVDTPYTDTDLMRNFVRIAFFEEYQRDKALLPSEDGPQRLKKWVKPVRISVEFGRNIPPAIKASERARVADYARRLSRITGHPVTMSDTNPNFTVMFMSQDDTDEARTRALQVFPTIARSNLVLFNDLPRSTQCFVITAGRQDEYTLDVALSYIRTELTDLQRLSCIHEEIAQGLGLLNDSPYARPSIFNDDDEFALLTTHDEELLRILYNPALAPGMNLNEARPIISRILAGRYGPS